MIRAPAFSTLLCHFLSCDKTLAIALHRMRETQAELVVSIRKYLKPIRSPSKAAMPRRIPPKVLTGVDGVDVVCAGKEGEDGGHCSI